MSAPDRFETQAAQYQFPYHYIPHLDPRGRPARVRRLWWAMEYLCYQHHAAGLVSALRPGSVLEVGCGDGRFIGMLQDDVARCVGVDLVEQAIRFATAFHPRVDFRCTDVANIAGQFDVVATVEVLEHIPDEALPRFVRGLCERVRPGGHLLMCVPSDAEAVHPKHYRHYNEALLDEHVAAGSVDLERISVHHVYAPPRWWSVVNRITCNSTATLEIPALNGLMWRYLWRHRLAAPGKGRHIIALYRRR